MLNHSKSGTFLSDTAADDSFSHVKKQLASSKSYASLQSNASSHIALSSNLCGRRAFVKSQRYIFYKPVRVFMHPTDIVCC